MIAEFASFVLSMVPEAIFAFITALEASCVEPTAPLAICALVIVPVTALAAIPVRPEPLPWIMPVRNVSVCAVPMRMVLASAATPALPMSMLLSPVVRF